MVAPNCITVNSISIVALTSCVQLICYSLSYFEVVRHDSWWFHDRVRRYVCILHYLAIFSPTSIKSNLPNFIFSTSLLSTSILVDFMITHLHWPVVPFSLQLYESMEYCSNLVNWWVSMSSNLVGLEAHFVWSMFWLKGDSMCSWGRFNQE